LKTDGELHASGANGSPHVRCLGERAAQRLFSDHVFAVFGGANCGRRVADQGKTDRDNFRLGVCQRLSVIGVDPPDSVCFRELFGSLWVKVGYGYDFMTERRPRAHVASASVPRSKHGNFHAGRAQPNSRESAMRSHPPYLIAHQSGAGDGADIGHESRARRGR
jgi:hypothetical protein